MSAVNETLIRDVVAEVRSRVNGYEFASLQMPGRRVPSTPIFFRADELRCEPIQVQSIHGRASHGTDPNNEDAVPAKMQPPGFVARIEQRRCFAGVRICGTRPRTLAQRTRNTSEGEVLHCGFAPSVERDDVINMKSGLLADLGNTAVFAAILRAMDDLTPEVRRDGHGFMTGDRSIAANAVSRTKVYQRVLPDRALPVFRRRSRGGLHPVCRATREVAFPLLWATENAPDHPALQVSVQWPLTYSLFVSEAQFGRVERQCPSLESANPCSSVSIRG